MSNWDLMMPGMGLTAIGLTGVYISYAGLAHTFIDGMHALTGLTMFIGLIFLSTGILDGGISTSNRAKATTLVIISISLSFAIFAFSAGTFDSTNIFAGILLALVMPAVVIAYLAAKMPQFLRPMGSIFALAAGAGIVAFVGFGMIGPSPYLLPPPVVEEVVEPEPVVVSALIISMLEGSETEGAPDYSPEPAVVEQGTVISWVNEDSVSHTATSSEDFGEAFDTGLLSASETYQFDTTDLTPGEYDYFCLVHTWMTSSLVIEGTKEPVLVSTPPGAAFMQPGQIYFDPNLVTISVGDTVSWVNNDEGILHTVTEVNGAFDSGFVTPGDVFDVTFTEEGTVDYTCLVHPWMVGTVIVE